ncbi:MAG: helix-turn-helix transcriptional regulator [Bacteroidaceae bacterium]|nr:helix-turn-helix transcriptional regulator [Bacteroidaceae bacterium]
MDIELLADARVICNLCFPYRIEKVTQVVVTKGEFSCMADFRCYSLKAPAIAMFLPGQVVESLVVDDEFAGFGLVMGEEFTNSMDLPVSLQERLFIKTTQFYAVTEEVLEALLLCYKQVTSVMQQPNHPYKEEIVKHLFSAYYYGLGYYLHGFQNNAVAMSLQQETCDRFVSLVSCHFREHRDIGFYAGRLCVSNKYLSSLLKQETGMTALEWIEKYVVLYAKSCLSSTAMTIQQISDELHFSTQSIFGKYFKRVEGISPKAYRLALRGGQVERLESI